MLWLSGNLGSEAKLLFAELLPQSTNVWPGASIYDGAGDAGRDCATPPK